MADDAATPALRALLDERARLEQAAGLAALDARLAAEDDPARRLALEEERLDVALRVTPLAARAVELVRREARAAGYVSARARVAATLGADPGALAAGAEDLLRATPRAPLPPWVVARRDLPRFELEAGRGDDAVRLLRTRLLAAAFLHDLDVLDAGADAALRERYARRMAGAAGVDWPSAGWLADADPLLRRAAALRAVLSGA